MQNCIYLRSNAIQLLLATPLLEFLHIQEVISKVWWFTLKKIGKIDKKKNKENSVCHTMPQLDSLFFTFFKKPQICLLDIWAFRQNLAVASCGSVIYSSRATEWHTIRPRGQYMEESRWSAYTSARDRILMHFDAFGFLSWNHKKIKIWPLF